VWWMTSALGAELEIELPPPELAELPLFVHAEITPVRGTYKGPECGSAVEAARESLVKAGIVLRWVRSPTDLAAQGETTCKQRLAGDNVSASVVDLHGLVIRPGPESFPKVSPARAAEIVELLHEVWPEGQPMALEAAEGRPWVHFPTITEPAVLDSRALGSNARGALLYERYVSAWVAGWARALAQVPEVAGASLELVVSSEDVTLKKSRTTELFRFYIPTAQALAYSRGELGDEALVKASRIERAIDPKKRDFLQFLLEVDEGSLSSEVTAPVVAPVARPQLGEIDDIEDE
jgi:hypothetical protein